MTRMHIFAKGKQCVFLPVLRKDDIFYFITEKKSLPGFEFVAQSRLAVNSQIDSLYKSKVKNSSVSSGCDIEQNFCEKIFFSSACTLFLEN